MKRVYEISFEPLWAASGKRPWWGKNQTINIIANGDALVAAAKARPKIMRRFIDETDRNGPVWHVRRFKITDVIQKREVEL